MQVDTSRRMRFMLCRTCVFRRYHSIGSKPKIGSRAGDNVLRFIAVAWWRPCKWVMSLCYACARRTFLLLAAINWKMPKQRMTVTSGKHSVAFDVWLTIRLCEDWAVQLRHRDYSLWETGRYSTGIGLVEGNVGTDLSDDNGLYLVSRNAPGPQHIVHATTF